MDKKPPFYASTWEGKDYFHCDGPSRLACVKDFDLSQCREALKDKGLQKNVKVAIERRIRKLEKANA